MQLQSFLNKIFPNQKKFLKKYVQKYPGKNKKISKVRKDKILNFSNASYPEKSSAAVYGFVTAF